MAKKNLVLAFIILLLIGGGVFWWQKREIKGSPEDYVIKETVEGKFVENKKAGLIVKVPEGWEVKKMGTEEELEEGAMVFYSPNTEGELQGGKIAPPLTKGCIIHVGVIHKEIDLAKLKLEVRYNLALLGVKSEEFEEVTINNYPALKTTADTQKLGNSIGIDIPYKNRLYSFFLLLASDEKENCVQEFNKFLETISIK